MAGTNWNTLMFEKQNRTGEGKQVAGDVLQNFMNCYTASDELRNNYFRCKKFVAGDQWGDETIFQGHKITEHDVLDRQGKYAVVNNFLRILIRNYVGVFVKQDLHAACAARGGMRQQLADVLSILLEYNWDINSQTELNASIFENGLQAPCFVAKVSMGVQDGVFDVWTEFVDFPHFIVDPNMKDPRGRDVQILGEIHDMPLPQLLSTFAKTKADRDRIAKIYDGISSRIHQTYKQFGKIDSVTNFLLPEWGLCRVFEIWTKEHRDGYYCHDYLSADGYIVKEEELNEIKQENARRIAMARSAGVPESDITLAQKIAEGNKKVEGQPMPDGCKLIKYTYFYEDYWYYRFLAPTGEVIDEGESPYEHGGHPYVFRFYPMLGGDARSFIEDVLDLQKDVNRMDSMFDWIMRHSAKGALLMPKDQMDEEDGWTLERYGEAWAQPDAVIPYNPKAGIAVPQQVSSNNTNIGLVDRINSKMHWIKEITGIEGALQGKASFAGQSGSMYAQQVEQGTTSLLPLLNTFSAWQKDLCMKQIKCMQQCYPIEKIMDICAEYGLEQMTIEDIKSVKTMQCKVRIIESPSSQAYRDRINQKLDLFLQLGLIDRDIYLNNTTLPFDWRLRRDIQRQAQMAAQQGQQPLPNAIPQQAAASGVEGALSPEAGGNNAYNRLMQKN